MISTGPERGKAHCYICETGDRPAIVIFARTLNEPLAKLCQKLDKAVAEHQGAELRSWVTFLNVEPLSFDPKVVRWAKEHALRNVPLGIFEDLGGPPSYRLARDADVTVLLYVNKTVKVNHAFKKGELNDEAIAKILKDVPKMFEKE